LTPAKGRQNHTTSPSAHNIVRPMMSPRPSQPALNVRDDAYAPPIEAGCAGIAIELMQKGSGIFPRAGLDHPNQIERAREIDFFAHAISPLLMASQALREAENAQI
jgi:hypothetical protein